MCKRKEVFLNKNVKLNYFTKKVIINNYNISSEEFDYLVESGFLKKVEKLICEECYRLWNENYETCKYCECKNSYLDDSYFTYN